MKLIPLRAKDGSVRAYAKVDDEDYDRLDLGRWAWSLSGNGYVRRATRAKGKYVQFSLHRVIMGLDTGDQREVDHIDGDPLNNARSNLRILAYAGRPNQQNKKGWTGASSRHRGVSFHKQTGKWRAYAGDKHIGLFVSEDDAANAAREYRLEHMPYATA